VLVALVTFHYGLALGLRAVEATQTKLTVRLLDAYRAYRDQRLRAGAPALEPNAVVAGDRAFVDLAAILENQRPLSHYAVVLSPSIADADWEDRMALNGHLMGLSRAEFADQQRAMLDENRWGPWSRGESRRLAKLYEFLAVFDRAAAELPQLLRRHSVRYVAIPKGRPRPSPVPGHWSVLQDGPTWVLWRIDLD
jgi:hypothetical protein